MDHPLHFLLINGTIDQSWIEVLKDALAPLGAVRVVTEAQALQAARDVVYDLTVVDAAAVKDVPLFVAQLADQSRAMKIIVATASPTWTRAREAMQSGAIDYIRKSLDPDDIRATVRAALEKEPASWLGA